MNKKTKFIDLGLVDYKEAWDYQTEIFNGILTIKSENRSMPGEAQKATDNYVIFCEHPHVFTLGKSGNEKNLLVAKEKLHTIQATYYHINRGGDITYHGPGQIVIYPVFDLDNFFTDIHKYLRYLEEAVILTLADFGIAAGRISGLTGVWIEASEPSKARKIAAFGVKASRWVTMHGIGFNVNTDLNYFQHIIPCGIADKAVTSMERELGKKVELQEVNKRLLAHMAVLFELELELEPGGFEF